MMEESRLSLPLDQRKKPIELAIRKFIFGSFRVFDDVGKRSVALQDDRMDLRNHASAMRAMLYRFSRLFREQLSTLLIDIDQIETTFFGQNNLGMESLQPEYDLTAYLVTTWHLCEIFLLNQSNSSSLEAVVWLKMNGVPPIDWEGALETFRSIRAPQNVPQDQIPNHQEFWPTIYALILEGKLDEAWQILSLHSDLAEVITSDRRSDSERDILEAIYDVMTTHPFINVVNTLSTNSIDCEHVEISSTISAEFKDWQDKVSSILQSSSSLLGRVSELNTMLQLLVGDKETLIAHSKGEWTTLSTGLFLYVYPPPLIRADISKIIESAMNMMIPRKDISEADRIREEKQKETMRNIMNGDAMVVLKNLIEVCGWGTAQTDHCSLFGLLSTSHLTYILSLSGITAASTQADSSIPLYSIPVTRQNSTRGGVEVLGDLLGGGKVGRLLSATLPNECSFVEELFLESSQRLNELQYPLDIVVGYLRACPLKGSEYARAILPRRKIHSDSGVYALCRALRTFGLKLEACAVEASRGSWWLQQRGTAGSSAGRVTKAVRFYQLAGDLDRTNALVDRTLWRCSSALVTVSQILSAHEKTIPFLSGVGAGTRYLPLIPRGLRMRPVYPRGPVLTGDSTLADFTDLRHYPETHTGGNRDPPSGISPLDHAIGTFLNIIGDAEEILGALLESGITGDIGLALQQFVSVVRALLTARVPHTDRVQWKKETDFTQILVGISPQRWNVLFSENSEQGNSAESVLQYSVQTLCTLIRNEAIPMRFWLPILDLCVGLDVVIDRKRCACLYSRSDAYNLLEAVERVIKVQSNYNLHPPPHLKLTAEEERIDDEDRRTLRVGLLGILSGAVIQSNADAGYTRIKRNEDIKLQKIDGYNSQRSPIEKTRKQDALEMLSI